MEPLLWAQELSGLNGPIRGVGNPRLLLSPRAALVGSRVATGWGLASLEAIAMGIAAQGIVVVSGGAVGSDCVAHRAALAAGGSTIVVLPCRLEDIDLAIWRREWNIDWDMERVLFLSPFQRNERPRKNHPIIRNRLVAALAHVGVVGSTGISGGTNHTLSELKRLSRPVYVLDTQSRDARLQMTLKTLASGGARLFSAEQALSPSLHAEIVRATIQGARRDEADSSGQMRFCEPTATYGTEPDSS